MAALNLWHQLLLKSLEANKGSKTVNFVSLATVRPSGQPANRTVVFRGFQEGTSKLQFNTDSRTKKIEDLRHSPWTEVCWYFADTWEQYRLLGQMEIVGPAATDPLLVQERTKMWRATSPRIQAWFLGPPPGEPVDPSAGPGRAATPEPPDTFCLLNLTPVEVDYVNLQSNTRSCFTRVVEEGADAWRKEDLNP